MPQNADITNTTLNPAGSETTFIVPVDTYRLLIQALTTDHTLAFVTSGPTFTIVAGAPPIELKSLNLNGKTFFFDGTGGTVKIMALSGHEEK